MTYLTSWLFLANACPSTQHPTSLLAFFVEAPTIAVGTDYERSVGVWLGEQRSRHAAGTLDHSRRQVLDQQTPGWILDEDDTWTEHARTLADRILFKRSTPRVDSKLSTERSVAYWLRIQLSEQRMGKLRFERRQWLDEHCPGWLATACTAAVREPQVGVRQVKSKGGFGGHQAY